MKAELSERPTTACPVQETARLGATATRMRVDT